MDQKERIEMGHELARELHAVIKKFRDQWAEDYGSTGPACAAVETHGLVRLVVLSSVEIGTRLSRGTRPEFPAIASLLEDLGPILLLEAANVYGLRTIDLAVHLGADVPMARGEQGV